MLSVSRFHEIVRNIPRGVFERSVQTHGTDKHSKGFRTWDQMLAMVYAQLSGAQSLREVEAGFNAHASHHFHLGTRAIRRSTLADANSKRSANVFADVATALMSAANRRVRQEGRALLQILDATSFTLKGRGYDDWCAQRRTRHTQGMKLHLQYAPETALPVRAQMSMANVNDISVANTWPLQAGELYVFDKGYCDYAWWHQIDQAGARFVTRAKRNTGLRVLSAKRISKAQAADGLISDEQVCFKHLIPRGGKRNPYTKALRLVTIDRPDHDSPLVLISNDLESTAQEIAHAYKQRWQIELYFKWIKQHLRIKRFLGESETAVRTQVMTALIAYLLVAILHQSKKIKSSLWTFLSTLRAALFQRHDTDQQHHKIMQQRRLDIAQNQPELFV
jgi:putative transposase